MAIVECKAEKNTKLLCLEAMVNEKYIGTAIAKRTKILLSSSGYVCQFKQDQTASLLRK